MSTTWADDVEEEEAEMQRGKLLLYFDRPSRSMAVDRAVLITLVQV
jgi:hypothetical protein